MLLGDVITLKCTYMSMRKKDDEGNLKVNYSGCKQTRLSWIVLWWFQRELRKSCTLSFMYWNTLPCNRYNGHLVWQCLIAAENKLTLELKGKIISLSCCLSLYKHFYYVMDWKFLFACLFFSMRNRVWKNRVEAMPSAQAVQSLQSQLMWFPGLAILADYESLLSGTRS